MKKSISCLVLSVVLSAALVLQTMLPVCAQSVAQDDSASASAAAEAVRTSSDSSGDSDGYYAYLSKFADASYPTDEAAVAVSEPVKVEEGGSASWEIQVPKTGLYNIRIDYTPIEGKGVDVECGLLIDGTLPFSAAEAMPLTRTWKDSGEAAYIDAAGNEYHPVLEEVFQKRTTYLAARDEYVDGGYRFYFTEGQHTLTLTGERESFFVNGLCLCQEKEPVSYEEYLAGRTPEAVQAEPIQLEGEDATYRSHATLYSAADMSSPATSPYDPAKSLLNTIGGDSWGTNGQWLEWEFEVETPGFYQLSFREKQNYKSGSFSVRSLYVDGEIPFKEAQELRFMYDLGWKITVMGGDQPQYLWLDKGPHTIRLKVAYGAFTDICAEISDCVEKATKLYRQILMITGSSPDKLRDYHIGTSIPGCEQAFGELSDRLYGLVDQLEELVGSRGSETAALEKLALQLKGFHKDTETAPKRLSAFSANISGLAAGLVSMAKQQLLLDYVLLSPVGSPLPKANAPWYASLWNEIQRFCLSFIEDYDNIDAGDGSYDQEPISIWMGVQASTIGVGRDQAITLQSMIMRDFTKENGIPVNIRLIASEVLLNAVAANKGPDLVLYQAQSTVINYALRGAAYDLNNFADADEVKERFHPEAVRQYTFQDALYALPEQMNYNVMFVRKDVMKELGLETPETWEELYETLTVLQRSHMHIGAASSFTAVSTTEINPLFLSILYQNGGSVYDESGKECILNQPVGVSAFTQFCELYTKYGLPLKIDLLTRFRTGETPIVLNNVSFGNELSVSAPELEGLWEMAPLPGVKQADGTINNCTVLSAASTGAVMFSNAKNKENTWKFMKWWTKTETQAEYARQIETSLGRSGRWLSANVDAIGEVAWSRQELKVITDQLKTARCLPEVAGGYYTGRSVNNAVRTAVNDGKGGVPIKETLYDYVRDINKEMIYKRRELGLQE